jgi:hypothetical protein
MRHLKFPPSSTPADLQLDETITLPILLDATASKNPSAVEIKSQYPPIDLQYNHPVKSSWADKDPLARFHDKNRPLDVAAIASYR